MENKEVIVTKHGSQRLKERLGLTKKARARYTNRAYNQGYSITEAKGGLKKWMIKTYLKQETAGEMRVYGNHCFLFDKSREKEDAMALITVLLLPVCFRDLDKYTIRRSANGHV